MALTEDLDSYHKKVLKTLCCGEEIIGSDLESEIKLFRQRVPGWSEDNARMFFDSYPDEVRKELMVLKTQSNGTCAALTVVTAHHDIVVCNRHHLGMELKGIGMIDVPGLLRSIFNTPESLSNYLSYDFKGLLTEKLLRQLYGNVTRRDLDINRPDKHSTAEMYCALWVERLEKAPMVVTMFVHDDLNTVDKFSYGDEDAVAVLDSHQQMDEGHAMLMVGSRVDSNGTVWFALQNWWPNKIFVEMTFDYLRAVEASVIHVEKRITDINTVFNVELNYHKSLHTCLDKGRGNLAV